MNYDFEVAAKRIYLRIEYEHERDETPEQKKERAVRLLKLALRDAVKCSYKVPMYDALCR